MPEEEDPQGLTAKDQSMTFEDALYMDAAGHNRTEQDIIDENIARDELKKASVTDEHRASIDNQLRALLLREPEPFRLAGAMSPLVVGDHGIDQSWGRVQPAAFPPWKFVVNYLWYPGDGGKSATLAEATAYTNSGYWRQGWVMEVAAGDCLRGYAVGFAHGQRARLSALDRKWPAGKRIRYAADTDTNWQAIAGYHTGFRDGIKPEYLPDPYGGIKVTDPAVSAGCPSWQTIAWSGGVLGKAAILQNRFDVYGTSSTGARVQLDGNVILHVPAEGLSLLPEATKPPVPPPPVGGELSATDADRVITEVRKSLLMMYRGDTDAKNQPLPPGKNTHPVNDTFRSGDISTLQKSVWRPYRVQKTENPAGAVYLFCAGAYPQWVSGPQWSLLNRLRLVAPLGADITKADFDMLVTFYTKAAESSTMYVPPAAAAAAQPLEYEDQPVDAPPAVDDSDLWVEADLS